MGGKARGGGRGGGGLRDVYTVMKCVLPRFFFVCFCFLFFFFFFFFVLVAARHISTDMSNVYTALAFH